MRVEIASVDSLIIYFEDVINLETSKKVKAYFEELKNLEGIIEIVPSYTSILITYDIFYYEYEKLKEIIESIKIDLNETRNSKLVKIPVYYGEEVGLDLQRIASFAEISIQDVIDLHSLKTYNVYAVGFAPGFAYLGNVDKKIAMNRLDTPRKAIPKGSVAIANEQTAIYPNVSPGGWNIIGKTTFEMFDKSLETLCPVEIGDKIEFEAISKEQFLDLGGEI